MSSKTTPPTARRFAPTPVETTSWSSTKTRRFPIQPVETSMQSNHKPIGNREAEVNDIEAKDFARSPAPMHFLPMPVETSFHSNRQNKTQDTSISPEPKITRPLRKFTPQLIEKTKRSRRAGDTIPATLPTDKTDLTPGVPNIYTSPKQQKKQPLTATGSPGNTPRKTAYSGHLLPFLPRRQSSMRPHCNTRQASFTSSLEPISSSESNSESSSPSHSPAHTPSLSGSILSVEDPPHHIARTRESCDERFSGYLLALAAKAAEKQLREQALLAAFPNETKHEIVEHFYDREIEGASDNDSIGYIGIVDIHGEVEDKVCRNRKAMMKRKSSESNWAIQEMQKHQDKCARLRDQKKPDQRSEDFSILPFNGQTWLDGAQYFPPGKSASTEIQFQKMRKAASPPMLGTDIKFRVFPSPKATKFESDQKINLKPKRCQNGGGLWGGYCVAEEPGELSQSMKGSLFIHTPMIGETSGDPFATAFDEASKPQNESPGSLRRLRCEEVDSTRTEELSREFDDDFVTQVYNYLSLGYPSLARKFDHELSRISNVPIEKLRSDDHMNAKGHIGLKNASYNENEILLNQSGGDSTNCTKEEELKQRGARWHALKLYILEWGKQHPSLSQTDMGPSAWGVRARRGSWGN